MRLTAPSAKRKAGRGDKSSRRDRGIRGALTWRGLVLLLGAVIVASFGLGAGAYLRVIEGGRFGGHLLPGVRVPFGGRDEIVVLILGLDVKDRLNPKAGQRSDSIMLARVNFIDKTVRGISVPRDTRVTLPGAEREDKINAAYAVGGIGTTIETLQRMTGIEPDYHVVSEVEGFQKIVDLIGGVDLDVEKDMNYDDNWQNLHIHLKKGFQHLNGEQAMGYVRFRKDLYADMTRMQRQQKLLRAVAQRMMSFSNLPRLPQVMTEMKNLVSSDIESADLVYLATSLRHATGENISIRTIPGEPRMIGGVSYFIPFENPMREMVTETFHTIEGSGVARVEVLNGTRRRGLASSVAKRLEESGFTVSRVGNAGNGNAVTTEVVYHPDYEDSADEILTLIGTGRRIRRDPNTPSTGTETGTPDGVGASESTSERNETTAIITVILGRDAIDARM